MCPLRGISYFLFSWLLLVAVDPTDSVEVSVKQGTLRGTSLKSRNGTNYHGFYGVPFAKPPVGDLRFEPPQEPDQWNGTRDATIHPPVCVQVNIHAPDVLNPVIFGQEDCLYLNVFTPETKTGQLPTMVYIHGGAFIMGSATFNGPDYFMDHPVVMVIIQYRLNIFGFLSASDEELPGNYGMKDQVAALKWVQENIEAFGGDPKKVTIFGGSAGAASTHLHVHSPLSKGLFSQAISQSGSALAIWAVAPPQMVRDRAFALGVLTGCPTKSTRALVACLKKLSAKELVKAHNRLYIWDNAPVIMFPPVVEPKSVADAFLTENPWKQDVGSEVPWIIGMNSAEGGVIGTRLLSDDALLTELNKDYKRLFPIFFCYGFWSDDANVTDMTTEAIRKFYFGDAEMSTKNARAFIDFFTDGFFTLDCLEAARRHKGTTFLYYYDHRNTRSFNELFGTFDQEDLGVAHADDMISFFHLSPVFPRVIDGPDFAVSERMIKYWVNFAHTGNPSGTKNTWKPVQLNDLNYLHIKTEEDIMEKNLLSERFQFWASLLHGPSHSSRDLPNWIKDEL